MYSAAHFHLLSLSAVGSSFLDFAVKVIIERHFLSLVVRNATVARLHKVVVLQRLGRHWAAGLHNVCPKQMWRRESCVRLCDTMRPTSL